MNINSLTRRIMLGVCAVFALAGLFVSIDPALGKKGGGGKPGGGDPPPNPAVRPAYVPPAEGTLVWPQVGRDTANSGSTPFLGPVSGVTAKWTDTSWGLNGQPVIDSEGNLIGASSWKIICLDRDGQLKWWVQLDRGARIPAIAQDGTVYAAGFSTGKTGKVYAIDPSGLTPAPDGQLPPEAIIWEWETPVVGAQPGYPRFVPTDSGGIVYAGFNSGEVVALDADPNVADADRVVWSTDIDSVGGSTFDEWGALAYDEVLSVLYAGADGGKLYALDGFSGAILWSTQLGNSTFPNPHPAVGLDSTIYVTTRQDSSVRALYPDGSEKWRTKVRQKDRSKLNPSIGAVALDEFIDAETGELRTTIYVGVQRGLQAFNRDGTLKWKWEEASSKAAAAPAVGADGVVYFQTNVQDPNAAFPSTFALSPDGELLWSILVPSAPTTPLIDTVFDEQGNLVESILYVGKNFGIFAFTEAAP